MISLQVANADVRMHATAALIAAFPITNDTATRADRDSLLQRQFDVLKDALEDASPAVRVIGVEGACKVVGIYWELIPPVTITGLVSRLVVELSYDAASWRVRMAVCKGLAYLLDNHLSQALLANLLPDLKHVIHDPVERVRACFIDLLLVVKGIRGMKFWDIVPVEHLLARLCLEQFENQKRLVKLLLSSFFPLNKSDSIRLDR